MSALDIEPFPKFALISAGALVAISLIGTTAVRLAKISAPETPTATAAATIPVASLDLRFEDQADGSVRITRAADDGLAGTVHPGEGGFIRGVMRGLARDRISRHINAEPPFRLSLSADGQLTLFDTATGRLIDLESFGQGNRASFFDLLRPQLVSQRLSRETAAIVPVQRNALGNVTPRPRAAF
jgi:putative photosynthetic complex assembly protein